MKRIYHPYWLWEEYHAGMWRKVGSKDEHVFLEEAIQFTGDAELYGSFMVKVVYEWPYSCEHNLTCSGMNRRAWIGHAAACLAIKLPEYITRLAWHELSQEKQDRANIKADEAIAFWEKSYEKGLICQKNILELTSLPQQRNGYLGRSITSNGYPSAIAEAKTVQLCFTW